MFVKCTQCNQPNIFVTQWLAGDNICSGCRNEYNKRLKNRQCIKCGSTKEVHYNNHCKNCHLKNQEEEILDEKIEAETVTYPNTYPKQQEPDTSDEYGKMFLYGLIAVFVTVLFLRLAGAFDANFKSESEIKLDLYQECVDMNGIDCRETFLE